MDILFAAIRVRKLSAGDPVAQLLQKYVDRASHYLPCSYKEFASETALFDSLQKSSGRTRPWLLLADSRGKQLSSMEFAAQLGAVQDSGAQTLVVAIGPADGWSAASLQHANLTFAFGRITLPHELAAVIAAEQIYRALTIRAGHPYHSGH